ncbi:MAG: SpoIIE family protein phosphatase [Candidatus Competibacteraceae bacterium]|nr:SpoIIE family protein phosphatase [Candidatus Competibacteraceae bacterium]
MRILVADDDPTSLMIISAILARYGHEVRTASDGLEARRALEQETLPFVISDWGMPGLDGPALCRWLRAAQLPHYVYFIMLTARGDKASLVEGMEAGADDFLVKPVDAEELRVRIRAGERILALERQLEERNQTLEQLNRNLQQAYQTIRSDMDAAAALQKDLLPPPATVQGVHWDWLFRPSHFVAGDMFGYFPLSEHCIGFYQLDVSGHGTSSALLSFTLSKTLYQGPGQHGLLKRISEKPPYYELTPPVQVVEELNRRFQAEGDNLLYFTLVYGVLETATGRVSLTQAGHPAPLWWQRADARLTSLGSGGFPVGLLPDATYELIECQLAPGDRLFLYSDGVTDCDNLRGECFSLSRLRNVLERTADRPLSDVIGLLGDALRQWNGGETYHDDVSLLALEWHPPQEQTR